MVRFFIIFYLFFTFLSATETKPLIIDNEQDVFDNFRISYFKDLTKLSDIKDIENKDFDKSSKNGFSLGYKDTYVWLKINILNKSDEKGFILTLNESFYEIANLFYYENGNWVKKSNSLFTPINKREIEYNKLTFKFNAPKDKNSVIYIQLHGKYSYFGKISIYKEKAFLLKNFFDMNSFYIFIFGTTFIILIFSIGLSVSLKEKIYYYYTGYTFFNLIYLIKMSGMLVYIGLQEYIYMLHLSGGYLEGFLILFSLEYLNTKKYLNKLTNKILKLSSIPYFLVGTIFLFDYRPWNEILNNMSLLLTIFFLSLSIYIYFKGHKKSKYYTFSLFIYFLLGIIFILMLTGILEYTNFTRHAFAIGTSIENIIFAILIISRYNEIKNRELKYQEELIYIKNGQEKFLRYEVEKRTNELTISNNKLSNMLKERELLLKEILHRVKNNFHMILGILWFESEKHKDKDIFSELMNRIKSMSRIHEYLLYSSKNIKNIKAKEYLKDLIESISSAYTNKKINK